eukprot:15446244-Alexandrium_andersonii.AAC.1
MSPPLFRLAPRRIGPKSHRTILSGASLRFRPSLVVASRDALATLLPFGPKGSGPISAGPHPLGPSL